MGTGTHFSRAVPINSVQCKRDLICLFNNCPTFITKNFHYIGHHFQITDQKLHNIGKRFCRDINIKLVFISPKIKNIFSFEHAIPCNIKSLVVYEFTCAGCNFCYIGETIHRLATIIKEHTSSDKKSRIYKHLQNPNSKSKYTRSCIIILGTTKPPFLGSVHEAQYTRKHKPDHNKQVQHFDTIFQF